MKRFNRIVVLLYILLVCCVSAGTVYSNGLSVQAEYPQDWKAGTIVHIPVQIRNNTSNYIVLTACNLQNAHGVIVRGPVWTIQSNPRSKYHPVVLSSGEAIKTTLSVKIIGAHNSGMLCVHVSGIAIKSDLRKCLKPKSAAGHQIYINQKWYRLKGGNICTAVYGELVDIVPQEFSYARARWWVPADAVITKSTYSCRMHAWVMVSGNTSYICYWEKPVIEMPAVIDTRLIDYCDSICTTDGIDINAYLIFPHGKNKRIIISCAAVFENIQQELKRNAISGKNPIHVVLPADIVKPYPIIQYSSLSAVDGKMGIQKSYDHASSAESAVIGNSDTEYTIVCAVQWRQYKMNYSNLLITIREKTGHEYSKVALLRILEMNLYQLFNELQFRTSVQYITDKEEILERDYRFALEELGLMQTARKNCAAELDALEYHQLVKQIIKDGKAERKKDREHAYDKAYSKLLHMQEGIARRYHRYVRPPYLMDIFEKDRVSLHRAVKPSKDHATD